MSYQRCTRCVMDNASDDTIHFDENGHCSYCTTALSRINTTSYFPNEEGQRRLEKMLAMLKEEGKGKDYDCVMGISGGLDSSYLAYLGYKWGLRILAVHIDDGFDTEISKENIRRLCEAAKIDLRTIVPDQTQYDALTRAYMEAGVPDLTIPQDNILFAFLYDLISKSGTKYFLSGSNFALECILQKDNNYNAMDVVNIRDINRRFGTQKINKLKFVNSYQKYARLKLGKVITLTPLDYIDYNRQRAFRELKEFCGFEYYGRKHLENILTAFTQLYWLPKKFNFDKRTSHLSSMIVSGQMTRDQALEELEQPMCEEALMDEYLKVIKSRLKLNDEDFDRIMAAPTHQHAEYKTDKIAKILRRFIH